MGLYEGGALWRRFVAICNTELCPMACFPPHNHFFIIWFQYIAIAVLCLLVQDTLKTPKVGHILATSLAVYS